MILIIHKYMYIYRYRHGLGVQANERIAMDHFTRAHAVNPKLMVPLSLATGARGGDGGAAVGTAGAAAGPAVDGRAVERRPSQAMAGDNAGGGEGGGIAGNMLFSPLAPTRMASLEPTMGRNGSGGDGNADVDGSKGYSRGVPPLYGAAGKLEEMLEDLEERTGLPQQTLVYIGVGAAALSLIMLFRRHRP